MLQVPLLNLFLAMYSTAINSIYDTYSRALSRNNTLNIPRTFDVFVIKIDVSASLVVIFQIIQSERHHMSLSTNGSMRRQGVQI